jgi:hypothetical protein
LVSLSGAQSVNIVKLLIIIERPSPKIVRAIEATAAWLESAFIEGRRVIEHPEDNRQGKNWMAFHKLTFASYCWTKDVIRRYGRVGKNSQVEGFCGCRVSEFVAGGRGMAYVA